MTPIVSNLVTAALTLAAIAGVTRQCRKPSPWLGRVFLWIMNRSHHGVTAWGLEHVTIAENATVLDVGCGGGRTVQTLAAIAREGFVYGVDYSRESVAAARRTNAAAIQAGRVDVLQATVSRLPFPAATFDLVTAVETMYYWPDPVADLREIGRVLKPGGQVLIIAETYRGRRFDALYRPAMALLRATYLNLEEHRELLSSAGFADAAVFEQRNRGWLCATGRTTVPMPGNGQHA